MKSLSRGGILPIVALCLAALLGFAGLAVDVGFLEYRQQAQQVATDAAALGAAQQLLYRGCPNASAATTTADSDAASNGFASVGNPNVTVTVKNPPASGPYASNNCAVSVSISTTKVSTWFSRLFGFAQGATETTQAVGTASYTGNGCIYLLSQTQQSNLSNIQLTMPSCGIYINDSANFSNSTIAADSILYAGTGNNTSNTTFADASPAPTLPFADPCSEMPGCAYLTSNPPSLTNCTTGNFQNQSVDQGCYSSLTLQGNITLTGGLYVINGKVDWSNAHVTGSNVTIYMTSNASSTNFSTTHITLSAPTTGNTANVLFYRPGSQSAAVDLSNCTCNLAGILYFPTTSVNVSNFGANYTVLIFGIGNFSNSVTFDDATPSSGSTYVGQAVLNQ